MVHAGMNYLAVLVAAVAGFAFGAAYYTSLSKPWLAALGKTKEEMGASPSKTPFVIAAVAQLVMAFVLAGAIGHLGEVTLRSGVISSLILWAGFVATTVAVNYGFQGHKAALTFIDAGHWLGVLALQGAIIGAFGV